MTAMIAIIRAPVTVVLVVMSASAVAAVASVLVCSFTTALVQWLHADLHTRPAERAHG